MLNFDNAADKNEYGSGSEIPAGPARRSDTIDPATEFLTSQKRGLYGFLAFLALVAFLGLFLIVRNPSANLTSAVLVFAVLLAGAGFAVRVSHINSSAASSLRDAHSLRSEVAELERHVEFISYYDETTRIPNRACFVREFEKALERRLPGDPPGCVLYLDLDDFQNVYDSHGYSFGDKVLTEFTQRLVQTLAGRGTVARNGGDEFLIFFENMWLETEVTAVARELQTVLCAPFSLDNSSVFITMSMGAARYPQDGGDAESLIKNASAAMYESKSSGGNALTFYNSTMRYKRVRRAAIMDILRTAIENDNVYLVFQPQVRSTTGEVVSCEALMRLRDCGLGYISPAEFIPIAEETRMIIPLGYWAIRKTIEAYQKLKERWGGLTGISVNVSGVQLRAPGFLETVKSILEEYDFDPSFLHLEVTESVMLDNAEETLALFDALRKLGVKLELDDFGTGYTSLNYVRMIPLDVIKIDKCFIDDIGISEEKESLISLIAGLAKTYNAKVVAEGVETAEQVAFLNEMEDVIIQGFYYSMPLEFDALVDKIVEMHDRLTSSQ